MDFNSKIHTNRSYCFIHSCAVDTLLYIVDGSTVILYAKSDLLLLL